MSKKKKPRCSPGRELDERALEDLGDRFDILQTKLDLLRDRGDAILGVLRHRDGHNMEVIIIALIAIEVVLGLLELGHRYG